MTGPNVKHRFHLGKIMNLSFLGKVGRLAALPMLLLSLTSCGGQGGALKLIRDVHVESSLEGSDLMLKTGASFWLGNLTFPAFSVPLRNYLSPDKELLGEMSFAPTLDSANGVEFWVNMSQISRLSASNDATLPNGEMIPVAGLVGADIYQLQVEKLRSTVYLALDQEVTMAGFALGIKQISLLKKWMNNANLFLDFNLKLFSGSVGLYTGDLPEQNGLAFFVDLSPILSAELVNRLFSGELITGALVNKAKSGKNSTKLKFADSYTGDEKNLNKVKQELQRIASKKEVVEFIQK